ncbi:16S rRNA (cytosine(1402)-N(4))-methyltransferase RsmH [Tomitella fengzijianii]|uniref:Ribosomal RNA small subunit methyltransferase H n=1 Tax=Tomitella fengzijianii TaxID=2597660 RepID=A0A516X4E6_9ACTN|nr:16S rRNA (cytosine(1402)-N(4))-methyltransferase RsmH [Tomitella fengzijianii]QDQ97873.1 16S rRNA (cytosine(1402)-N(4))-methyltransferase RsmH [Tomitella fengzijianii]
MTDGTGGAQRRSGEFGHVPVLLRRAVELLGPAIDAAGGDAVFVDCTLGMGGHSEYFLERFPGVRVIGLDRDTEAIATATRRLAGFAGRFTAVHTRYDGIAEALDSVGIPARGGVDAILFDLGVSSLQLDEAERGFAYSVDAPLDMRMDGSSELTAATVINTYTVADLRRILSTYGEERFAAKIAAAIVRRRESAPFRTTGQLVELLYEAIPAAARRTGGHPAKRTFQALRIEVNGELDSLRAAVPAALDAVTVGGRVAFMAYQSLEDRIVKRALAERSRSRSPQDLPVELPGTGPEFQLVTRGAERATEEEIAENPRSAPVRLRCARRIAGS